jgi:hypothetical protein
MYVCIPNGPDFETRTYALQVLTNKLSVEPNKTTRDVLMYLQQASASASRTIKSNMEYKSGVDQIVGDGYEVVFEAAYSVLPLMCITCEEVGVNDFVASVGSKPVCTTNTAVVNAGCQSVGLGKVAEGEVEATPVDTGLVIGVIIGCLVLMGLTGFGIYIVWQRAIKEEQLAKDEMREQAAEEARNVSV